MARSSLQPEILIITPQKEPPVRELAERLGGRERVTLYCSDATGVWGARRGMLAKTAYFIIDPLVTMLRLAHRVWRYRLVICYYHRNGYWLGILKGLLGRHRAPKLVWIGFAPNPKRPGLTGGIKEFITRRALSTCDLVICNTRPLVEAVSVRYPAMRDRLMCVRWGGGSGQPPPENLRDDGYVFSGGRTNRDFDTVLEAVAALEARTILVVGEGVGFRRGVPDFVTVYRNIPGSRFQSLIEESRVVVIALERPDISSGQVVLMQAMRCAKPVLLSATAGIDDYVEDGVDAVLFEPGNARDLAARLKGLLEDGERRRALGEAAAATYRQRFNSSAFARELSRALAERGLVPHPEASHRAASASVHR